MSRIDGKAKKYNGGAIDYVMLFDWLTGNQIGTAKPDAAGNWKYYYFSNLNCGITYVADGCEPITHGAYQFAHVERAPFVDFIGFYTQLNRPSKNNDSKLIIPTNVQPGDIVIVSIARFSSISISDDKGGSWILGADVFGTAENYRSGASIYYRAVNANDAGAVVTVLSNGNYNDSHLSVFRGKSKQLKVVKSVSNPLRYDDTFKGVIKNLAPIEHDGGFIVRATSTPYALSVNSKAEIAGMTNIGAKLETAQTGTLRLQTAYKHLLSADTLKGIKLDTGYGNVNDIVADVAIILDEV